MFNLPFLRPVLRTGIRSFASASKARNHKSAFQQGLPVSPLCAPTRTEAGVLQNVVRRAQARQYQRPTLNYQRFQTGKSLLVRWAERPTFYWEIGGIAFICGAFYVSNLEEVPISGRRRFNIFSEEREAQQGQAMLAQTLQEYRGRLLPAYTKEHRMVQRVLNRLLPHSGLQDNAWEIHVIDDPQQNAFVIPGGKVFVFRGILDICQNDEGLAAVLGHEIAHNVAHHAAERMSFGVVFLPLVILGAVLANFDPYWGNLGYQYLLGLPNGRAQEAEADYIGLLMMAESCYDPAAALQFWSRMDKMARNSMPEFFSTHPSNHNRMEKIQDWLNEAQVKRMESGCANTIQYANNFQRAVAHFQR